MSENALEKRSPCSMDSRATRQDALFWAARLGYYRITVRIRILQYGNINHTRRSRLRLVTGSSSREPRVHAMTDDRRLSPSPCILATTDTTFFNTGQ